jgi:hypothetical protein
MSGVASAGNFKPPSGVGSRNDGGGIGSGNWYAQFGEGEEFPQEEADSPPSLYNGNPFSQLTYISAPIDFERAQLKRIQAAAAQKNYAVKTQAAY